MSKKCRKEHVQIHTNVEQMSLKLVEYRVHVMLSRDRTYFCPQTLETQLMTRRTTLCFTTRSADKYTSYLRGEREIGQQFNICSRLKLAREFKTALNPCRCYYSTPEDWWRVITRNNA